MKSTFVTPRKLCLLLMVLLTVACSDDDAGLDDLFIPNIDNTWQCESRKSTFVLNAVEKEVNESDFTGFEFDDDGNNDDLKGHFRNYYVEITFLEGPNTGETYKGNFIKDSNPLEMTLKGTTNNETIHLKMDN